MEEYRAAGGDNHPFCVIKVCIIQSGISYKHASMRFSSSHSSVDGGLAVVSSSGRDLAGRSMEIAGGIYPHLGGIR